MEAKSISFKLSLSTAFTVIVLVIVSSMGIGLWINIKKIIRSSIELRLHDTVSFAVSMFPASEHRLLKSPADEKTATHMRLVAACKTIEKINPDIRYVYTMRQNAEGKIYFVVDSEFGDTNEKYVPIGEIYEDASDEIIEYFKNPEPIRILKNIYTDKWGTWLTGLALMKNDDGSIEGVIGMDISVAQIASYQKKYLIIFSFFLGIVMFIAIILSTIIARKISKPIKEITEDMQKIKSLDLQDSLNFKSSVTEIIEMHQALENMKKGLRSFRKFVTADLVNELIEMDREAVLGSERKEISIFFSDIRDFTTISEQLAPEHLAEMLGIYFEGMTRTLQSYNATVDKYIGDAIMAFWGAPKPAENHAMLACRSALACQKFLRDNRDGWLSEGKPEFFTRIGINTGEAVVGNMGYENRLSYTALGDSVNLASRLESLNKYYGTDILVNESTVEQVKDTFVFRMLDIVAVKGRTNGVRIYELAGERGSIDPEKEKWIASFNNAMDYYVSMKWDECKKILDSLSNPANPDKTLEIINKRIIQYKKNPPGEEWNGVIVMREK